MVARFRRAGAGGEKPLTQNSSLARKARGGEVRSIVSSFLILLVVKETPAPRSFLMWNLLCQSDPSTLSLDVFLSLVLIRVRRFHCFHARCPKHEGSVLKKMKRAPIFGVFWLDVQSDIFVFVVVVILYTR
jgi:hypothetical protein